MQPRSIARRRAVNAVISAISGLAALFGIFMMGWILYEVIMRGARAINWAFFTQLPGPPVSSGGGLANAMLGTLMMTALGAAIGIPIGLFAGVYLAEFGRNGRWATAIRFVGNLLMGTPSIITGVFVYTVVVVTAGSFSGYAGAIALAIIMLPLMARTSEDILALVPNELRESALALGAPRWRATLQVIFRAARNGLLTGALLAIARVSGETAPLLFTSLNSRLWSFTLAGPTPSLTVTTYTYAMSGYATLENKAWAASLVIILAVLSLTVTARFVLQERKR